METVYIILGVVGYILAGLGSAPCCGTWEGDPPIWNILWVILYPIVLVIGGIHKLLTGNFCKFD